jgi:hydrogenase maturation protease
MDRRLYQPALRALVIGYGNPLRGDDALGLHAAEALWAIPEIASDPSVRIESVHQLTPEVAESIADAQLVIFIDASVPSPGMAPGSMRCDEIGPALQSVETLGHHLTPAQTLAYARGFFGANSKAYVASIVSESFDYGAPLSAGVEAAVAPLVEWVLALLQIR